MYIDFKSMSEISVLRSVYQYVSIPRLWYEVDAWWVPEVDPRVVTVAERWVPMVEVSIDGPQQPKLLQLKWNHSLRSIITINNNQQ